MRTIIGPSKGGTPREGPLTRKFAERAYILSPPYEGIEHREPAYHSWRSEDCSRIDSPCASRRGARAYGSKRLRKKHSGKGPGRSSGLSCDRGQGLDGRGEPPGT